MSFDLSCQTNYGAWIEYDLFPDELVRRYLLNLNSTHRRVQNDAKLVNSFFKKVAFKIKNLLNFELSKLLSKSENLLSKKWSFSLLALLCTIIFSKENSM